MIICTFIQKKYYRKWAPYTFLQFPCLYIKLSRCCFYYVKTKEPFRLQSRAFKIFDFNSLHACCCFYYVKTKEAQDCHPKGDHGNPKGDHGNPKGYNQGRSLCMQGQSPWSCALHKPAYMHDFSTRIDEIYCFYLVHLLLIKR